MPYINQVARERIARKIQEGVYPDPQDAGELNYLITSVVDGYFQKRGGRYQQINDVIGALEGAKMEFYRRVVAPYEDGKIKDNGDVYVNKK